jgi:hypothetical protein
VEAEAIPLLQMAHQTDDEADDQDEPAVQDQTGDIADHNLIRVDGQTTHGNNGDVQATSSSIGTQELDQSTSVDEHNPPALIPQLARSMSTSTSLPNASNQQLDTERSMEGEIRHRTTWPRNMDGTYLPTSSNRG